MGGGGVLPDYAEVTSFQPATPNNDAYQRIAPNIASNNNRGMSIASFITDGHGKSNVLYNKTNVSRSRDRDDSSEIDSAPPSSVFRGANGGGGGGGSSSNSNAAAVTKKVPATAAPPAIEWAV